MKLNAKLIMPNSFRDVMRKGVSKQSLQIVKDVASYAENRLAINLKKIVYDYVPKLRGQEGEYKRTGRLLRGRRRIDTANTSRIESNPRLQGARINYSKIVEDYNKKTKVPARPYFKTTKEETQKEAEKIMKRSIDNYFKTSIL